jgi:hypothetical protein
VVVARTTRWRAVALPAALVAVATATSLALRANAPMVLESAAPHDDALFARLAGNLLDGRWLGPYDKLTLAKGPTYPLFVAAVYQLHLPLKLAEHALHLAAGALVGVAVWRVTRSRLVAVVVYVAIALDPAYLGAWASKVARENLYGSLSLMLVAGLVIFLTYVPALVRRGPAWAVPTVVAGGAAFGVLGATYYLCRDERAWLVPALVVAAAAGLATWRGTGRVTRAHVAVLAGTLVLATGSFLWSSHWVTGRNQQAYGTSVASDLVDGEIARAYTQWQRVDLGGERRRFVPVDREQRRAVYAISPAAAELEPHLEGPVTAWFAPGCAAADVCDDFIGGHFVWAIRDAADAGGHMVSGAEAQRFFGEIADDIEAACADDLPCVAPGIGPMPPLSRVAPRVVARSVVDTTGYLFAYDVAEPERGLSGGGGQELWDTMVRPLRGVDGDEAAYLDAEARALDRQGPVSALMVLYRWAGRVGVAVATAGVVAALATRAGRRRLPAVLAALAMLTAVAARVAFVALIDATSYPAWWIGAYILPGVAFLVVFVVLGCWLLATSVRDTRTARAPAHLRDPLAPPPPEPEAEPQPAPAPTPEPERVPEPVPAPVPDAPVASPTPSAVR